METARKTATDRGCFWLTLLAALVGSVLVLDAARSSSATYDESAYLRIGSRWWRTGDQEQITRMGSPLTFWKLQQAPTLWLLDRLGYRTWIDDPVKNEPRLLPALRMGALWVWLSALGLTCLWARQLHGSYAMTFSAWLFALSPNLIAHGALVTMEMPIVAACAAVGLLFSSFLRTGGRSYFVGAAIVTGLALSLKFTAVLIPPICGLCWFVRDWERRESSLMKVFLRLFVGMSLFVTILLVANLMITGFAVLPLSETIGEHPTVNGRIRSLSWLVEMPIPQDWVGFATQIRHQRSGGPSYLLGVTRMNGWWYYYPIALVVKIPPVFWLLVVGRLFEPWRKDSLIVVAILAFLSVTIVGSTRNYGVRYLLPIAPLALVWLSGLMEGARFSKGIAVVGIVGYAIACVTTHPRELTYFPQFVGGAEGGRRILADSNLDWGQGLRDLAKLQKEMPEFRDLTLYYFGDNDPKVYGVAGTVYVIDASDRHPRLPTTISAETRYVAVSASLQFGPWGPKGYFESLRRKKPVAHLPDWTIAIYESRSLLP